MLNVNVNVASMSEFIPDLWDQATQSLAGVYAQGKPILTIGMEGVPMEKSDYIQFGQVC